MENWRSMMGKNVLVVDDDELIRRLATLILKTAGYSVIEAVNGQDALNKLSSVGNVEMVLTDFRMPQMDGIEFVKQLRANAAYKLVPIVMMTSEFQEYKRTEGEQAGVTDWISKPFLRQQLIHAVRRFSQS